MNTISKYKYKHQNSLQIIGQVKRIELLNMFILSFCNINGFYYVQWMEFRANFVNRCNKI